MKWLILLTLSTAVFADDSGVRVQGNCEIKVVPDRAKVSFTAENQSKVQQEAVTKTNAQMNSLKEKIQALKLSDVEYKTTNYSVFPVREWEKDKNVDKGTRASMTLEISTSDIARLGEAMVEASKINIQNVGSMEIFLSLEKSQAEYLKCLDIASVDARRKADQLAKKLGFKIGNVESVIESPVQISPPIPMRGGMMLKSSLADSAVPVEAGTQNFSTTIQVTYTIQ